MLSTVAKLTESEHLRLRFKGSLVRDSLKSDCIVSLSKALYPLLSTQVQPRKTGNLPDMTEKLLTGT